MEHAVPTFSGHILGAKGVSRMIMKVLSISMSILLRRSARPSDSGAYGFVNI